MIRKLSENGINLIKSFEGCRLTAYKAVSTETYWTIGYGHYGADVVEGMQITQNQADLMLSMDLQKYEAYVNNPLYCPVIDQLNQNQFDALVSFCYNCGVGNLRDLCSGASVEGIPKIMLLYNKSGGAVLSGLTKRRQAEVDLYNKKDVIDMQEWAFDFIESVMKDYYKRMEGNPDVQEATHQALNNLRVATGRKEE